jgi:hypothetical protein
VYLLLFIFRTLERVLRLSLKSLPDFKARFENQYPMNDSIILKRTDELQRMNDGLS